MTAQRVLALDVSVTATGWAVYAQKMYRHGTIKTDVKEYRNKSRLLRYQYIVHEIVALAQRCKIDVVLIEGYSYNSAGNATVTLAELGGYLRGALCKVEGLQIYEIAAMSYRKLATGCGTIVPKEAYEVGEKVKDKVIEYVRQHITPVEDDNAADALLLAWSYVQNVAEFVSKARRLW